jgi:hypothetical protein
MLRRYNVAPSTLVCQLATPVAARTAVALNRAVVAAMTQTARAQLIQAVVALDQIILTQ